jgi:hypothetical protein
MDFILEMLTFLFAAQRGIFAPPKGLRLHFGGYIVASSEDPIS